MNIKSCEGQGQSGVFESLHGDDDPNALKTQVEADGRG